MSGGFFRGTTADQDTRFSNKQAKLLKSQKFPAELEHLVDMTKVKADVIKPWIAKRVTELLGFEDEVLINFIYGLLDGKNVNGKEVQISLTGFMEKNTGKFMKELWELLLSAQKNSSGVPQQFLDAKEEETRKKKAESDRIVNEIQKKKEKEIKEREPEKLKQMDGDADNSKSTDAVLDPNSKQLRPRDSGTRTEDEKETTERNGLRGRYRVSRSPYSAECSPSPSRERLKSRSISCSPQPRGRSTSSERVSVYPRGRSVTPCRKDSRRRLSPQGSISPLRRTSSHFRRRSISRSRHRSPSPIRRRPRSPFRRRSPSPGRRRSRSPFGRRHSPMWGRSPSPVRRRSPRIRRRSPAIRRRSPSLVRRRSPALVRHRSPSPVRHRSPPLLKRRSSSPTRHRPSPVRQRRRRSSSTPHRGSLSPMPRRSPVHGRRRLPSPSRRRSPSPYGSSSASPVQHRSPLTVIRKSPKHQKSSSVLSPRRKIKTQPQLSPIPHAPLRENVNSVQIHKRPDSVAREPLISMRSPQRDLKDRVHYHKKGPSSLPSQDNSPHLSESPCPTRKRSPSEDQWSSSSRESPVRKTRQQMKLDSSRNPQCKSREQEHRHDDPVASGENEDLYFAREQGYVKPKLLPKQSTQKDFPSKVHYKEERSSENLAGHWATDTKSYPGTVEPRRKDRETKCEKDSEKAGHSAVAVQQNSPIISHKDSSRSRRQQLSASIEGYEADKQDKSYPKIAKDSNWHYKLETLSKLKTTERAGKKSESMDLGSEESDIHRAEVKGKRKHVKSYRKEVSDDDYSSESEIEDRKDAKRRRREGKRLRKEERRRRREERRRRKEERRAEKLKPKTETVFPATGSEKNQSNVNASDSELGASRDFHSSDAEEIESEQKRLEIELRKKALESLKAKKGISH